MLHAALVALQTSALGLTPPPPRSAIAHDAQKLADLVDRQIRDQKHARRRAIPYKTLADAAATLVDAAPPQARRLRPHDIPVVELHKHLTPEALRQLLAHEACAVHVRDYLSLDECASYVSALDARAWTNWRLHGLDDVSDASTRGSDVDRAGVVASDRLSEGARSMGEYLDSARDPLMRSLFEPLKSRLGACLGGRGGCAGGEMGGWPTPLGTFRRMHRSDGLIHIDTAAFLTAERGEFAANVYVRTGGRGNLRIYPAMQYSLLDLPRLHALTRLCADGCVPSSQQAIRERLPLPRTLELRDGDLVLLSTGRFHEVERFDDVSDESDESGESDSTPARLSAQCWLSHQEGAPLQMWV